MKKIFFYCGIGLLPVFLIVVAELSLRLLGVGQDYSLVIQDQGNEEYFVVNPEMVSKYFPDPAFSGFGYENKWPREKSKNTFRIAALGGSTTAGFPYFYNGSFPAILKQTLQEKYPEVNIELANLGMSAISSTVVKDIARQTPAVQPDVVVIYMGHNEFYGVFGATWKPAFLNYNWIKSAIISLQESRLYQSIKNILRTSAGNNSDNAATVMEKMGKGRLFSADDPAREKVFRQFYGNLDKILQIFKHAGIPVILCSVTSNIMDQRPFRSPDDDRSRNDKSTPLDNFNIATDYWNESDPEMARKYFTLAHDGDAMPFRAPSGINAKIRQAAENNDVILVDIDAAFHAWSPEDIPGKNLFLEHVHPNLKGNTIIAKEIAGRIEEFSIFRRYSKAREFSADFDLPRIHVTRLDSVAAAIQIKLLIDNPPFTFARGLSLQNISAENEIEVTALKLLTGQLNYKSAHLKMAGYYQSSSMYAEALGECQALVEAFPYEPTMYRALISACIYAENDNLAITSLKILLRLAPDDPFGNKWSGIFALKLNQPSEAVTYLKRAKWLRDDDLIRYNLSGAYLSLNNKKEALLELDTLLARNPGYLKAAALYTRINQISHPNRP